MRQLARMLNGSIVFPALINSPLILSADPFNRAILVHLLSSLRNYREAQRTGLYLARAVAMSFYILAHLSTRVVEIQKMHTAQNGQHEILRILSRLLFD